MNQAQLRIDYTEVKKRVMELAEIDPLLAALATAGLAAITTFYAVLACLSCEADKEDGSGERGLAYNS